MPRLLRDIVVASFQQEQDIEVIETPDQMAQLDHVVASTRPDVLVVECGRPELHQIRDELLSKNADLRLLAISHDARTAFLCELRPHEVELLDVSPQSLLQAIRRPREWLGKRLNGEQYQPD
jgi:DNA-binding NarL/FixJ family response regulator